MSRLPNRSFSFCPLSVVFCPFYVVTPTSSTQAEGVSIAITTARPTTGQRSNPEWKQFSVLLKRETQREAAGQS